jgi:hypothetical protein
VSTISTGKGHWLKSSQDGTLILQHGPSNSHSQRPASSADPLTGLNSMTIADAAGNSHTLYFGTGTASHVMAEDYALPPLPPPGCFDVRFDNGGEVLFFSQKSEAAINIQSVHYPLTIRWDLPHASDTLYSLDDAASGSLIATLTKSGTISVPSASKLILHAASGVVRNELPAEFSLAQNMPNPFNPSTRIAFALPRRSIVHMTIYSLMGQVVAQLADGEFEAGFHSVDWSPSLASGLYFYRLEAVPLDGERNLFSSTKKMLFLK